MWFRSSTAAALESAHKKSTHIIEMLAKSRVKKPKIAAYGMRIGGRDQAWLYRDAMRSLWQQTPGRHRMAASVRGVLRSGA